MKRVVILIILLCVACLATQAKKVEKTYLLTNIENPKDTIKLEVTKKVILFTQLGDTPVGYHVKEVLDEGNYEAFVLKRADNLFIMKLKKHPESGDLTLVFDSKSYILESTMVVFKGRVKITDVL